MTSRNPEASVAVPIALGDEVRAALPQGRARGRRPAPPAEAQASDKASLEALPGRSDGRVAEMSRHLGITRPKLYRLLRAEGLDPPSFRGRRVPG